MFKGLLKKWKLFGVIAFALLAISTTAISTMAWFTIERSQTIETGMVTGSGEIAVSKSDIQGHKVLQERKSNGYVNYGNTTVTTMNYDTSDFDTENSNQEGADTNFDIPTNGIGYYFIPAVNDSFRYANGTKMQSFSSSDSNLGFLDGQTITAGSYRIREYGFKTEAGVTETVSRKISISNVNSTDGRLTATVQEGDVVVTLASGISSATCKVWFDHALASLAFDVTGTTAAAPAGLAGPNPYQLYGTETVYLNTAAISWFKNDGCSAFAHVWGTSGDTNLAMTEESNGYWSLQLNVTTYPNVLFFRSQTSGGTWHNKTNDLTFPTGTDSNRCYRISSSENEWLYGSWENKGTYSPTYKMKINGSNEQTMQINSTDPTEICLASSMTLNAGDVLSFTANGTAVTVTPKSGANNLQTNGNNVEVKGKVKSNVYVKLSDGTVWVDNGYTITVGSTEYTMETNPGNTNEVWASVSGARNDDVAMKYNGSAISGGWSANTSSGNNISTGKKILVTFTNEGAYFNTSSRTLWVEGNKTYSAFDGTTSLGNMSYVSSGDYQGWYSISNVSVTEGKAVGIKYTTTNASGQSTTTTCTVVYHSVTNNNLDSSTKKFIKSGHATIYYNTSNNHVYVTPVYSVTIGSTNLEAVFQEGHTYRTATSFSISAQDHYSVTAYVNKTVLNYGASTNANNNLTGSAGSLTTECYSDSAVYADIYTDSSTLWVSGYHDPIYSISITHNATTTPLSTTKDGNLVTATANVYAGDTLTFVKNKSTMEPSASGSTNNVEKSGQTYTIHSDATSATITWNVGVNPETVFVSGRAFRYHFCKTLYAGNSLFTGTPKAYATDAGGNWNAAWPGVAMTEDTDGTYYIDLTYDKEYTTIIFNDVGGTNKQTADLSLSGNENKYYWITDSATAVNPSSATYYTTGKWYANPPSNANAKTYYFHDKYLTTHFGSSPTIYGSAWYNSGSDYINAGAAIYPGEVAKVIVPGSLYSITVGGIYPGILFSNNDQKTLDLNVSSVATGSVFLARESLDSTYSRVTGDWGAIYSESGFGQAKIHIYNSAGTVERTRVYESDGTLGPANSMPQAMRNGDTSHNYYIFEEGIYAKQGETFTITYSDASLPNLSGSSGTLDGNKFVNDAGVINTAKYPFLTFANGGTIGGSGKVTFAADGRYNFYVTAQGQISVAMVPIYGNGFYVMPYESTTEGFAHALKMNTVSATSGSYTGFKVDASQENQYYFRSYLNAVDTLYSTINIDSELSGKASASGGVLTFSSGYTGYINIEIANGQVYIRPYKVSEFFCLDPLDISKTTSQNAIKAQITSLVLEVKFSTESDRALDIYLDVGNNFHDGAGHYYVGCAVWMTTEAGKLSTPWEYMRANRYGTLSTASTLKFNTHTTGPGNYYAYILIDYYWNAGMTANDYYAVRNLTTSTMTFDLHTEKAA